MVSRLVVDFLFSMLQVCSNVFSACCCEHVVGSPGHPDPEGAEAEVPGQGAGSAGGAGQLLRPPAPAEEQGLLPHSGDMHARTHTHMRTYARTQARTHTQTHTHTQRCTDTHTQTHTNTHTHTHTLTHTLSHRHTHTVTHSHAHTYTQAHRHKHTHTNRRTLTCV